jgi:hypothetical protein
MLRRILSGDLNGNGLIQKADASADIEESSLGAMRSKWLSDIRN